MYLYGEQMTAPRTRTNSQTTSNKEPLWNLKGTNKARLSWKSSNFQVLQSTAYVSTFLIGTLIIIFCWASSLLITWHCIKTMQDRSKKKQQFTGLSGIYFLTSKVVNKEQDDETFRSLGQQPNLHQKQKSVSSRIRKTERKMRQTPLGLYLLKISLTSRCA